MKVRIISEEQNPLLKRREVTFKVEHAETGGTPARFEVRKQLATLLKAEVDLVYIKRMETKTGTLIAIGEANAYNSMEQAKLVEPKHIMARNISQEQSETSQASDKQEELEEKEERL